MSNLAACMYTRICTSGSCKTWFMSQGDLECLLNGFLYGSHPRLNLPAVIVFSIVFYEHFVSHGRNLQRTRLDSFLY